MFQVTDGWREAFPGAAAGMLVLAGVHNPSTHPAFEARKEAVERQIRERYAGYDRSAIRGLPVMEAYNSYYKRFKKTYHVQLQLESVALKGRSIPKVAALVETMFLAELEDLLLTAGHDLALVQGSARLDVSTGTERYIRMNGQEQQLKVGDMMICDQQGVISSVIYGPDQRTRINAKTKRALFTTYAPAGVGAEAVQHHLENIRNHVLLIAPGASTELLQVVMAP